MTAADHRKLVNGHSFSSPARFSFSVLVTSFTKRQEHSRFLTDCFIYQTEVPRLNSQCLHFLTLGCLYANIYRCPQAVPLVLFCLHSLHDWHVASAIIEKKKLTWKCVMYVMCISVEKYLQSQKHTPKYVNKNKLGKKWTWKYVMYVMYISVEKYLEISNILTSM